MLSRLGLKIPMHKRKLDPSSYPACRHHNGVQHAPPPKRNMHVWNNQYPLHHLHDQ